MRLLSEIMLQPYIGGKVKGIFRFVIFLLILEGISEIWEFIDIGTYGYSQRSAADAIATVFIANWFDNKLFGNQDSK